MGTDQIEKERGKEQAGGRASHLSADFTGDGKPDIAVLYDYGNNDTAVLVFRNTGSGFSAPVVWWDSGPGNWIWANSKPLVGDFTGDGKPDIAVAYDYGNSDMGLLILANTGTSFSAAQSWYRSGPGGVNLWAAKLMAADFDGDGKIDIGVLYDYGNNDTALLVFKNTGSAFSAPVVELRSRQLGMGLVDASCRRLQQ